jgi:nicotinate phosphoribosyltransferase
MMYLATEEEIRKGKVTDVYFERTRTILENEGIDKRVRMELVAMGLPREYPWALFAGLEDVLSLLEGMKIDVEGLKEGSVFKPYEPVLSIEGSYLDFGIYETAILGLLCQASGIATYAARCCIAAHGKPIVSFGARRMHPSIAPMIDRSAYLGGCDGVAVIKSAEALGLEPKGTIPHALVLLMGDTVEATLAFHRAIEPMIGRVSLVDTFNDEKFEAVRVASALGRDLAAVRLDTPGSRRGDFRKIVDEVRWELNLRGFEQVKIMVSGGIDEHGIGSLWDVVDAFGVGTSISNAPVIDFSLDIVEVDGQPLAKRGKESGGKKTVACSVCEWRGVFPSESGTPPCPKCQASVESCTTKLLEQGKLCNRSPSIEQVKAHAAKQVARSVSILAG